MSCLPSFSTDSGKASVSSLRHSLQSGKVFGAVIKSTYFYQDLLRANYIFVFTRLLAQILLLVVLFILCCLFGCIRWFSFFWKNTKKPSLKHARTYFAIYTFAQYLPISCFRNLSCSCCLLCWLSNSCSCLSLCWCCSAALRKTWEKRARFISKVFVVQLLWINIVHLWKFYLPEVSVASKLCCHIESLEWR